MPPGDALFEPLGAGRYQPSRLTAGPWTPDAQHGGAPAALLAHAVEAAAPDQPMQVSRLTFGLVRPVPLTPLAVRVEVTRPGRKVQLLEATLRAGDSEVVRARALRIRTADLPALDGHTPPEGRPEPVPDQPSPEAFATSPATWEAFHNTAMDVRFVAGGFGEMGPATAWFRLTVPVVAGEPTRPLSRLVAAADFGNGISRVFESTSVLFINPDLTVHVLRPPEGEWVALRAATATTGHGIAMAEGALFDEHGRVGRSVQSLLLDRR